jgi:hypothetical protein
MRIFTPKDSQNLVKNVAKKSNISFCLGKCRELFFEGKPCCDQQENFGILILNFFEEKNDDAPSVTGVKKYAYEKCRKNYFTNKES